MSDATATPEQMAMRKATLAYIEINPNKHEQSYWADNYSTEETTNICGTKMCIAGTASFLDARMNGRERFTPPSGVSWTQHGMEILGLDEATAGKLFSGGNSNSDAVAMLRALCD